MIAGIEFHSGLDVFRLLIIAGAFFDLGLMIAIHYKTRKTPAKLTKHLKLLGVSYGLWLASSMVDVYHRFGTTSFKVRSGIEAGAVLVGFVGLMIMNTYYDIKKERINGGSDQVT